jgi:hypothetical protein
LRRLRLSVGKCAFVELYDAFHGQDCASRHTKLRPSAVWGFRALAAAAALNSGLGGLHAGGSDQQQRVALMGNCGSSLASSSKASPRWRQPTCRTTHPSTAAPQRASKSTAPRGAAGTHTCAAPGAAVWVPRQPQAAAWPGSPAGAPSPKLRTNHKTRHCGQTAIQTQHAPPQGAQAGCLVGQVRRGAEPRVKGGPEEVPQLGVGAGHRQEQALARIAGLYPPARGPGRQQASGSGQAWGPWAAVACLPARTRQALPAGHMRPCHPAPGRAAVSDGDGQRTRCCACP